MSPSIVGLCTPRSTSAIHIVRMSGSESLHFLKTIGALKNFEPRRVYTLLIRNPYSGKVIDEVVALYFKAPHSYTGEDVVELHTHGSLLVVDEILELAQKMGFILARGGEFTQRAFLNGKMSIVQAQAVDALIRSSSIYLKDNALKLLTRQASLEFDGLRKQFQELMASLEASVEFHGEDVDRRESYEDYRRRILYMREYLNTIASSYQKAKKREEGVHLLIVGAPNVGKSTLMNLLLGEERSIVSDEEGTTRDYVKERVFWDNRPLWIYDSAGIRKTQSEVEKRGIEKVCELLEKVDFVLFLTDERMQWDALESLSLPLCRTLIYVNKQDLLNPDQEAKIRERMKHYGSCRFISLRKKSQEAIEQIKSDVLQKIQDQFGIDESQITLLNEIQWKSCQDIEVALGDFLLALDQGEEEAILIWKGQEVNRGLRELSLDVDEEEVFDKLFSSFCIGK